MHPVRSARCRRSFRWAALWFTLKILLLLAATILMVVSLVQTDWFLLRIALGLLGGAGISALLNLAAASEARCPLCKVPVMSLATCARHRRASHAFGSHRLPVASSILFTNTFTCPFCHEPVTLKE